MGQLSLALSFFDVARMPSADATMTRDEAAKKKGLQRRSSRPGASPAERVLYSNRGVWTVRALEKTIVKPLVFLIIISVLIVNSNRRFLFWDEEAREIVDVLPKDPKQIPTIYKVSDTETDYLLDDSMIVGVVVDGASKAYPLMVLDRHEVVNDQIGDTHIIVSYCPLTNSPLVFTRPKQASFGVSGKLFRNNLVLYDNVSETLWSQIYMRGIQGEQKDTPLDYHPCNMMKWGNGKGSTQRPGS